MPNLNDACSAAALISEPIHQGLRVYGVSSTTLIPASRSLASEIKLRECGHLTNSLMNTSVMSSFPPIRTGLEAASAVDYEKFPMGIDHIAPTHI